MITCKLWLLKFSNNFLNRTDLSSVHGADLSSFHVWYWTWYLIFENSINILEFALLGHVCVVLRKTISVKNNNNNNFPLKTISKKHGKVSSILGFPSRKSSRTKCENLRNRKTAFSFSFFFHGKAAAQICT